MTAEAPSFRRNAAWTLAGNTVYAVCQWGMLVAAWPRSAPWPRSGNSGSRSRSPRPSCSSRVSNLRAIESTDARREYPPGEVLALRLASLGIAALAIVLAAIVVAQRLSAEVAWVVAAVGVAKIVESISDVLNGVLQQRERMAPIARSSCCGAWRARRRCCREFLRPGASAWGAIGYALRGPAFYCCTTCRAPPGAGRARRGSPGTSHPPASDVATSLAYPTRRAARDRDDADLAHLRDSALLSGRTRPASRGWRVHRLLPDPRWHARRRRARRLGEPRLARLHARATWRLPPLPRSPRALGVRSESRASRSPRSPVVRSSAPVYGEYAAYAGDLAWICRRGARVRLVVSGLRADRGSDPEAAGGVVHRGVPSRALSRRRGSFRRHGVRGAAWALLAGYAVQLSVSVWICRAGLLCLSRGVR